MYSFQKHRNKLSNLMSPKALAASILAGTLGFTTMAQAAELGPTATDQIIVKLAERENGMAAAQKLSKQTGKPLRFVRNTGNGRYVFRLPEPAMNSAAEQLARAIMRSPQVEYAEADLMMQPINEPVQDTYWSDLWALEASDTGIGIEAAWGRLSTGASPAIVAVLDTGITSHPDLNANIVGGYDMISNTRVSVDGNGRDSDPTDPGDAGRGQDSSWHGTHVAGTIAAVVNNSEGIAGVGGDWVKVVPVRVLGKGGGYTSDIVDGILWAAGLSVPGTSQNNHRAHVINMSLGGGGSCSPSSAYQSAIDDAIEAGTTVVVAAGNSNADAGGYVPASCSGVITVAATGDSGERAYYSNYGATVEVAAPGGDMQSGVGILSTWNTGRTSSSDPGYAFYQGTSMASPHAAGVAALLYVKHGEITPELVTYTLQSTAKTVPCVTQTESCGAGLIDAAAALALVTPATSYTPADPNGDGSGGGTGGDPDSSGDPLEFTTNPTATVRKNRVSISWETNLPADTVVVIGSQTFGSSDLTTSHKVNVRGSKGSYSYTATSTDADGQTVSRSGTFTI